MAKYSPEQDVGLEAVLDAGAAGVPCALVAAGGLRAGACSMAESIALGMPRSRTALMVSMMCSSCSANIFGGQSVRMVPRPRIQDRRRIRVGQRDQ